MALTNCINCKYCEQGENCSFCSNPKPLFKDYSEYVYPPTFSCPKFEKGMSDSRKKFIEDNK